MELFLGSGEGIVDRYRSHLHEEVLQILPEALQMIKSEGRGFIREELEMGKIVGKTICVATGPSDQILYAKRPKRFGHTRLVKGRHSEPTSKVVVILKTADGDEDKGKYVLITAFIGELAEPEPWDRNATPNSRNFWNTHALVWGSEEIISGTETTRCPW